MKSNIVVIIILPQKGGLHLLQMGKHFLRRIAERHPAAFDLGIAGEHRTEGGQIIAEKRVGAAAVGRIVDHIAFIYVLLVGVQKLAIKIVEIAEPDLFFHLLHKNTPDDAYFDTIHVIEGAVKYFFLSVIK